MTTNGVFKDVINFLASAISLFAFITGYSSLPALVGSKASGQVFTFGVLPEFGLEVQIILILIGVPLFILVDTWAIISTSKIFILFLKHYSIRPYYDNPVNAIFKIFFLSPIIIALNLFFTMIVFGKLTGFWAITTALIGIIITAIFVLTWFGRNSW